MTDIVRIGHPSLYLLARYNVAAMGLVSRKAHAVESEGYRSLIDVNASIKKKHGASVEANGSAPDRVLSPESAERVVLSPITGEKMRLADIVAPPSNLG